MLNFPIYTNLSQMHVMTGKKNTLLVSPTCARTLSPWIGWAQYKDIGIVNHQTWACTVKKTTET